MQRAGLYQPSMKLKQAMRGAGRLREVETAPREPVTGRILEDTMSLQSLANIDLDGLINAGGFTSSPSAWEDEVLYFLLVDRFSDGQEAGINGADLGTSPTLGLSSNSNRIFEWPSPRPLRNPVRRRVQNGLHKHSSTSWRPSPKTSRRMLGRPHKQ